MTLPVRREQAEPQPVLETWDPFREMERMMESVGGWWPWTSLSPLRPQRFERFAPGVDIEETDDAYVVELDVPGVRKDDLRVEVSGRRVLISGERKDRERKGVFRQRTRPVGSFRFEVVLPGDVDDEEAQAVLEEGTLRLTLPKTHADRPRRIEVK
jgi:HSP20 family protein